MAQTQRPEVGWQEWAYLPNLGIGPIKVKIDTGARTSALHAYDVVMDGDTVRFKVHTIQGRDDFFVAAEAKLVEQRLVKDSGGKETLRPVISTLVRLCDIEKQVEVTLIDRQDMAFRMLVGRSALAGTFLVNPELSCLGGVPDAVLNWREQ